MADDEFKTYTVSVSERFDARIRRRMQAAGFHSVAEYIRSAIRSDIKNAELEELEWSVLEATRRGDFRAVDEDYFAALRQRAHIKA